MPILTFMFWWFAISLVVSPVIGTLLAEGMGTQALDLDSHGGQTP